MCVSSIQASKEFSGRNKGVSVALGDFATNNGRIKLYKVLRIRSTTLHYINVGVSTISHVTIQRALDHFHANQLRVFGTSR